ncbi:hypothetical protein BDZ89DRAFT_1137623 [Hymenopellis radicata]|nr:hypothetical protein BDZ89DRAFT_1137623 [Hymenopellis radicata]
MHRVTPPGVFYTVGYFFPGKDATPYERLASLLRLATKYLCHNLRTDIIAHFALIYPSKRADLLEAHPLVPAAPAGATNWHHSLEAVVIARENDVITFLPCAFYLASLLPLPAYIPYLPRLPIPDQYRLMNGRTRLTDAISPGPYQWQASATYYYDCENEQCQKTRFGALQQALRRGPRVLRLFLEPMPHEDMRRCSEDDDDEEVESGQICNDCGDGWEKWEKKQYNSVWDQLPAYFSLGSWGDIKDEPVPNDIS